ncbi:MAG TPA: cation-translocating P-type ATPase [Chthoniobacterales bacterium]|nr:cation-translocating P-type ATPase [Chthoniobacterales bacterium]
MATPLILEEGTRDPPPPQDAVPILALDAKVERMLALYPNVKQLRINSNAREIDLGFYETPSPGLLRRVTATVHQEFDGRWRIAANPSGQWPLFHEHQINDHILEFHRAHPPQESPLIWKRVRLPQWRNRPIPPATEHNYQLMLVLAGLCGLSTLAGFVLVRAGFSNVAVPIVFAIAYFCGGWFAAQDVVRGLKQRKIDIQFLMIFVALGAAAVGAWTEGATLLFLFSLSNALEQFANHRTKKTIESLLRSAPQRALRRRGESWVDVPIEEVVRNDELLIKAGELFPVDGVILEGATSADESALTGESLPVSKRPSDSVSSGTLNLDGQAVIRVERPADQSALYRILGLIRTAQQQKAPAQRFTDAFSRYYTWIVLGLSAAMFVILLVEKPFAEALYRTMTLLVVASPCALVLSIPSAILMAIAAGARNGILFRGGVAIENLAGVNQFAFDKTGTLTTGALVVRKIELFAERSEDEVLAVAAAVAKFSTHPLARAIVQEAETRGISPPKAVEFQNIPGFGMEAVVDGEQVLVGSRRFLRDRMIQAPTLENKRNAEVWVAAKHPLAVIYLRDEVRPAAWDVIEFLKQNRIGIALLTGDRATAADAVARQVGIEEVHAEITPAAKLQCIHRWRQEGKKVGMVGDGINDAPSLTAADVGIGMGARGSDAALEQADVILMHDRIENVEHAVILSRRARAIIRQNITISLGVVALLVTAALAQKINLTFGVLGHEGSTVIVVLNALRLLHFRGRKIAG